MKFIRKRKTLDNEEKINSMYVVCNKCGATIKITASDLENPSSTNIFPTYYKYKCGWCENYSTIAAKKLTHEIRVDHAYIHLAEYA